MHPPDRTTVLESLRCWTWARLDEKYLHGAAHKVTDDVGFVQFLLQTQAPFEWQRPDPMLRASQIVVALSRHGASYAEIVQRLEIGREYIENSIDTSGGLEALVQAMMES